jgi:GT2 family glycosyltransferase
VTEKTSISFIFVHYHTEDLLKQAVLAVLQQGRHAFNEMEILVVDNGSDPVKRSLFAELPVRVLAPGRNLGYAGGVNLGASRSRGGVLVVMNPDVLVLPDCLHRLAACLTDPGVGCAGPRFYWDQGRHMMLPPLEQVDLASLLLAFVAGRYPHGRQWAHQRWRVHAYRHWRAQEALRSYALSGALLAMRRDVWQRVGPFDESYFMYFEETDWLQRLRKQGYGARYESRAEAIHLYNQSAGITTSAPQYYEQSFRRFLQKRFGSMAAQAILAVSSPGPRRPSIGSFAKDSPILLSVKQQHLAQGTLWLEASLTEAGFPAAAAPLDCNGRPWLFPGDVWGRLPVMTLYFCLYSSLYGEIQRVYLEKNGANEGDAPQFVIGGLEHEPF